MRISDWSSDVCSSDLAVVVEPSAVAVAPFRDRPGVYLSKGIEGVAPHFQPDIVVFAVKPQGMDGVVPDYARFVRPQTVFLSIAAGKTIAAFAKPLGDRARSEEHTSELQSLMSTSYAVF